MICPKCGVENDEYSTVCHACGEPLTPGFIMCPNCGKVLEEKDKVCPRCHTEVHDRISIKGSRVERTAYTPKYVVKMPFSFPSILFIMLYMVYSLGYNIVIFISKSFKEYADLSLLEIIVKLFTSETRIIILLILTFVSIITFINRLTVNSMNMSIDALNKKLVKLKTFVMADVVGFFVYFTLSFWPSVFIHKTPLYYTGGVIGIIILLLAILTLPTFFKKSKVRTR